MELEYFSGERLDTWESDQEGLMEITKLLRHHYDTMDAVNHPNVIPPNTATKKRKVELNNRNISSGKEPIENPNLNTSDLGLHYSLAISDWL